MNARLNVLFADLQEQFARTREPLAKARQLPGTLYTSKEVESLEKERIFLRTWLCVGREEEVANPGDYMAGEVMDEPFVVARDKDGTLAAFVNMCLHRGVPVVEGRGNAKDFSCPYHAWLYDLKGRLMVAPHMRSSEADLKNRRMRELKLALWRGWIFITFNADAEPFEQFIEHCEKEYWWFKTDQCRLAEKSVLEVNCNWKLLVENLIDIYHVPVLHKASFGGHLKTDRDKIQFKLLPRGGWIYEQESRPHSKGGRQLFPTLPWLEGMSIGTSFKAGIFPNLNLSLRVDSIRMWQLWPGGSPDKTYIHAYTLFPEAAFAQPDFKKNFEEYKEFLYKAILEEDGPMVVRLQRAVASPHYVPGPLSHMEGAVHHLMKNYLDAITA
jgi:phenylpropionate dioxygenase-like ring-hydroxylating dioxygenase large terminal subunit